MKDKKNKKPWRWALIATVVSFLLTVVFSIVSQAVTGAKMLWLSVLTVLLFIIISIAADILGTALTACEEAPFIAMSSRKVPGAKQAVMLIHNNEKLASICNDIIGDICGILSGAATVSIVALVAVSSDEATLFWISVTFSALVSCMTIGGKAFGKGFAISRSRDIVLFVGKVFALFYKKD